MKTKFIFSIALLTLSLLAYAQDTRYSPDEYESAKTRPLIVMLETENAHIIKRLKATGKESRIKEYQALVKKQNADLKTAFSAYCNFTTQIEYKTKAGIDSLGQTDKYIIALFRTVENPSPKPNEIEGNPDNLIYWLDWNPDRWNSNGHNERDYIRAYSVFELRLSENMNALKKLPMYNHYLSHVFPRASDLVLSVTLANGFLKSDKGVKMPKTRPMDTVLTIKTLLIPKELLSPDLTAERIASFYPYKYEVVDDSVFDSRILEKSGKYLFLFIEPMLSHPSPFYGGTIPYGEAYWFWYIHRIIDPVAAVKTVSATYFPAAEHKAKFPYRSTNDAKFVNKESLKGYLLNGEGK